MPALSALFVTFLAPAAPRPARKGGPTARAMAGLRAAWRRQRERARIAALNPHLLRDIGVSWAEAEHEANKRFWQG